jgi:hypothetical protein
MQDFNNQIFLDSDGVLFDFDNHTKKYTNGVHPSNIPDSELWKILNAVEDFWFTMPIFPWAVDLVNFVKTEFYHDPIVITGCPKCNFDFASEQKLKKYKHYFPDIHVITCLSKNKPIHMKKINDVLLDDMRKNIKRWNAAGGRGILFKNYETAKEDLLTLKVY